MPEISDKALTEADLPPPFADWEQVGNFALTFNGYDYWGSLVRCGEVANKALDAFAKNREVPDDLTMLRTALFFEQRRWRHFGYPPDEASMAYLHALVEGIRRLLHARAPDAAPPPPAEGEDVVVTRHPDPDQPGVPVSRAKYDPVRRAIVEALMLSLELTETELAEEVDRRIGASFQGPLGWYVTTIQLDLEARGLVQRVPERDPVALRLAEL